jgi:hypothetical protein
VTRGELIFTAKKKDSRSIYSRNFTSHTLGTRAISPREETGSGDEERLVHNVLSAETNLKA